MSHYISDELYTRPINSDLNSSLKNQLTDLQKNDIAIKKSSISVRTLSNLEYDKFIKNSTLDGSISATNINV